jgi:hypothetical protein
MTRRLVYLLGAGSAVAGMYYGSLISSQQKVLTHIAVTVMTIASIILPRWIRWDNVRPKYLLNLSLTLTYNREPARPHTLRTASTSAAPL